MKKISLNKENLVQLTRNQMGSLFGGEPDENALLNADENAYYGLYTDEFGVQKKSGKDTDCMYSRNHYSQCGCESISRSGKCCENG